MTVKFGFIATVGLLVAACADKPGNQAADGATDQAAINQLHTDYTTHFNLHHPSVVADMYSDSTVSLGADGSVDMGKAAILKRLEGQAAALPTLTLAPAETKIFGDWAATRGSYTMAMTPPGGAAVTLSGNYMTTFRRETGVWKIGAVITNYDAPPLAGTPRDTTAAAGPPPPDNGTLKELVAAYTQHYNLGHAPVVAGLYTDSAYSAFGDAPAKQGRAAIEAYLTEQMAQGSPQLTLHAVGTMELPDGWAIDGGWFEVKATTPEGPAARVGRYLLLARRGTDNSWKIHWSVTNVGPAPASAPAN